MKIIKLSIILFFTLVFFILIIVYGGRRLGRTYLDFHSAVKIKIESIFIALPFDNSIKQAHFEYLRLTNRGHYNEVTLLNDGRFMLDTLNYSLFLHERADAIADLSDFSKHYGAQFIYVRIPSKLKDNSYLPLAFSDNYIIEGSNELMNLVNEFGVDIYDLRAEMEKDGVDFTTAFFRGDHHWTYETALWAFGKISGHLNTGYGFSVDEMTWDPRQFEHITYKNGFLGEESITINNLNNHEDITILVPKFNTDFVITDLKGYNYMAYLDSGRFADVFIPFVNDESINTIVFGDSNRWFFGYTRYENTAANENKNILLISDSMGIPLATYFANAFTRVDNIYMLSNTNHRVWDGIANYDYDLVIFAVSDVVTAGESTQDRTLDRFFLGYPPG